MNNENSTQEITLIAAASENNVLGKDNQLIWHISDDLKRFKQFTQGHAIIMGRKTFESFPKPLPNRTHIVITRQPNYPASEGIVVVNSIEKAIAAIKNDKQPYIIGGGEIYSLFMPWAHKIELTRIHKHFEGDAFFPEIDPEQWKLVASQKHPATTEQNLSFSYLTYTKNTK